MEFEAFDSLEEMMARLNEQMQRADAHVRPWQARIKTGDYFRRSSGYGFDIYGDVLPEEEPREPRLRHYRFCNCYSVACPEGEMGDVHVSIIEVLLTKSEFSTAQEQGWLE